MGKREINKVTNMFLAGEKCASSGTGGLLRFQKVLSEGNGNSAYRGLRCSFGCAASGCDDSFFVELEPSQMCGSILGERTEQATAVWTHKPRANEPEPLWLVPTQPLATGPANFP